METPVWNPFQPEARIDCEVDGLPIVLVDVILNRFNGRTCQQRGGGNTAPAVGDFRHPVQAKLSGRYLPVRGEADTMDREYAAVVFVGKQKRPARGGLEITSTIELVGIKTDGGVVLAGRDPEVVVGRVG
jgi:hypothetical protein